MMTMTDTLYSVLWAPSELEDDRRGFRVYQRRCARCHEIFKTPCRTRGQQVCHVCRRPTQGCGARRRIEVALTQFPSR